jgi:arsenate reductase (thioredoxin)
MTHRTPGIALLCVHNAGRSQMAAAWARHLGAGRVEVFSGGSDPAGLDPDEIRPIRDEIRRRVADLLTRLGIEPSPA